MCGIIGYLGKEKEGVKIVVNGLKTLEYRGYDSWGIAAYGNPAILVRKEVGKIGDFDPQKELPNVESNLCIGHTRWATHGGVTKENAHPHSSCDGQVVVVHNGIIENYQELKKELEDTGHKFKSQTDSEVISHLIEENLKKSDFAEATRKSLKRLLGSYAVLIIKNGEDILIGARKSSPMVLGLGRDSLFLASDVTAFLDQTKKVIYLDEEEMVIIKENPNIDPVIRRVGTSNDSAECRNPEQSQNLKVESKRYNYTICDIASGLGVKKPVATITWAAEQAQKGGYDHFLIKEIMEQPRVITETAMLSQTDLAEALLMINKAENIFLVACGTALCAATVGQYLFSQVAKRLALVISAAEFSYFVDRLSSKDLVIFVSQSGETADVLESARAAKKQKAKTLAIVNVNGSSLMRVADCYVQTKAGPEICVLSTKTYTSQVAALIMLAYGLKNDLQEGHDLLCQAAKSIANFLKQDNLSSIKKIAKQIKDKESIYIIGRGINYPTALEAAIKIKEVSYIHAEGFAGGDLKHGPIALIEEGVPALAFVASDDSQKEMISSAMEIRARGGTIVGIAPENNEAFHSLIRVADFPAVSPLINVVPAQVLSYYLALERGTDPDKPRNLAKSVTVK